MQTPTVHRWVDQDTVECLLSKRHKCPHGNVHRRHNYNLKIIGGYLYYHCCYSGTKSDNKATSRNVVACPSDALLKKLGVDMCGGAAAEAD